MTLTLLFGIAEERLGVRNAYARSASGSSRRSVGSGSDDNFFVAPTADGKGHAQV